MGAADDLEDVTTKNRTLSIRFPQRGEDTVAQDEEWCEVFDHHESAATKVRFHDYVKIFSIPGLYNQLFGGVNSETQCISPQVMASLLKTHLHQLDRKESLVERGQYSKKLRVLDFGAGNGMIGEEVRLLARSHEDKDLANSTQLIGFDILPEVKRILQSTSRVHGPNSRESPSVNSTF
ncbi:hypothetical protein LZ30DRAFT_741746 [Colletotrichum cereale]|nr:hypothetical protein LZ30DRAFT_741746 [Colletotrichum cereale]